MKKHPLWTLLILPLSGMFLTVFQPWGNPVVVQALAGSGPQSGSESGARSGNSPTETQGISRGRGFGDGAPVPVVAGFVERRDVPVYLNGIGNVQAFQTVTVRSRVDGQLEKILFEEGQEVKAGQLLAEMDPRPYQALLDQALARRRQDEALLDNARVELKRDLTLLTEKVGTAQKVDTQKALVSQLEATIKADDAAVEAARIQLDYTHLRSPIDGRTGIRLVDAGNVVRASESVGIVTVAQIQPVSVVFSLPEAHVGTIQSRAAAEKLMVLAMGRDLSVPLAEGRLAAVDNQIDMATGTIRLKATFSNEDHRLWPGQFVNVRLRIAVNRSAVVVPASVVQRGPQGSFVFVIEADSSAQVRPVQTGYSEDGWTVIESGLDSGERVVFEGQYRLQKGSKVRILESKSAPPASTLGAAPKNHP